MRPTLILGLPQGLGTNTLFVQNLEKSGINTIDISYTEHEFKYKNWREKTVNFFRKVFLNDKEYKNKLKFERHGQHVIDKLNAITTPVEYALLIRADIYPKSVLKQIREKSKTLIGYQWDGLHRFPAIYQYLDLFNRFYVFDKKDLKYKNHTFLPLTNFYFELKNDQQLQPEITSDLFFCLDQRPFEPLFTGRIMYDKI